MRVRRVYRRLPKNWLVFQEFQKNFEFWTKSLDENSAKTIWNSYLMIYQELKPRKFLRIKLWLWSVAGERRHFLMVAATLKAIILEFVDENSRIVCQEGRISCISANQDTQLPRSKFPSEYNTRRKSKMAATLTNKTCCFFGKKGSVLQWPKSKLSFHSEWKSRTLIFG